MRLPVFSGALTIAVLVSCSDDPSAESTHDAGPGGGGTSSLPDGSPWPDGATDGEADAKPDAPEEGGGTDAADSGEAPPPDSPVADGCTPTAEQCANLADDDCDGSIDCADPDCAWASCGADQICKGSTCSSVFATASVACGNSGKTGTELCQGLGFSGCSDSIGYWWWQCAGPGACPSGFQALSCPSYSTANDCVGDPIGGAKFATAPKGCASAYGATDFGYDCVNYNPGYLVRLRCK